ncbi:hypothetical protein Poli38472_012291 [Pythium oligandrum]|uniref:Uncharacterized protein n=1 Tax=Pythium oligandrum TaxID=41045 RepID=A0A8K1CR26_PYTOL|nr:hypothetical protein Poli38472_012291 [Pythium oligandrum]|eukprot:TMW67175.1 hypothetical protein Poli38472_012291 [Pythium oligandrum]
MWKRCVRVASRALAPATTMRALPSAHVLVVRHKFTVPDSAVAARRRRLKPKLANDKFVSLASAFLDRVEVAVTPLQPPMNEDFALDRSTQDVVLIKAGEKEFELKVISAKQQLHLTSPISGLRKYEWNQKTQRWEDESDAHDLEGLLTRDLMRLCSGVPAF